MKSHYEKHGEARNDSPSSEYTSFYNARSRCVNPRHPRYADYGGRGIRFEFSSFAEFLAEVGRRPSKRHLLDRIDNDGNYEPGNVRWATRRQSRLNQRARANKLGIRLGEIEKDLKAGRLDAGQKLAVAEWLIEKVFGRLPTQAELDAAKEARQ